MKISDYRMIRISILIAFLQLLAISCSWTWTNWLSTVFPTATQLPVGVTVSFCLTALFSPYLLTELNRSGETTIIESTLKVSLLASVIAAFIAFVAGYTLFLFQPSLGRVLVVVISTFSYSCVSILASSAIPTSVIKRIVRSKPAKAAFAMLFGILVCVCLIGMMEFAFSRLMKIPSRSSTEKVAYKEHTGTYLEKDAFYKVDRNLGVALHPNCQVTSRLNIGDAVIWDTTYSTDEKGRRLTVNAKSNEFQESHQLPFAMFFGCSYMFGEGCSDGETIPSQFAKFAPNFEAYNFGVPGYGTQHMLAILENPALKKEFEGRRGIGIYLYLEDIHEARVIGDMDIVTSFGKEFPCYRLDSQHKPQRRGSFSTGSPIRQKAFEILAASQTRKYFGLNFPKRTETDYELTAAIVAEARSKFLACFPDSEFFVIRYPHRSPHRKIDKYLDAHNVEIIDLSELFDSSTPEHQFVGDGHPTPVANAKLASKVAENFRESSP
jgi:hypothetical protein